MMQRLRATYSVVRESISAWNASHAPRLAAALSYYTIFSLAPLLIVVISVAGLVFGREAVQGEILAQMRALVGGEGATAIEQLITHASKPAQSGIASIVGVVTLLLGAAGVMGQLKEALNAIWEVPPDPRSSGIVNMLKERFLSFALVLAIGFVLLVSLVVSAGLAAANRYMSTLVPGSAALWMVIGLLVSFAIIAALFAALFKFLPDAQVRWSDVWVGAIVTAALFEAGKFALGMYIGRAAIASAYGAAGSLVVVLVWVYYSAQIVFLGAAFTRVYARRYGSGIVPAAPQAAPAPRRGAPMPQPSHAT